MQTTASDDRYTTSRIRLGRDQATMFYATRGTVIVAEQGNILIGESANQWLGLTTAVQSLIGAGECHALQRDGWLRLQAVGQESADGLVIAEMPSTAIPIWLRCWHWLNATPPLKE
ncbi:hypothetical protein ACIPF8_11355 [Collimonas sp. NPDC087041]|uniref:hypothetical protein n=1 Tax=Collimonas sp. NPDC087041 TaxID=3363960 RepID=UPI00380CF057